MYERNNIKYSYQNIGIAHIYYANTNVYIIFYKLLFI